MAELECVDGKLVISEDHEINASDWGLFSVSEGRYIVQNKNQKLESKNGLGWCSIDMFYRFLVGVVSSSSSGVVFVLVGDQVKKIYFNNGDICFAGSDLIDDRLAEVAYRAGYISVDDLVHSTVKVTKDQKFGKVLLNTGIFSKYQLWQSLKTQIRHIVDSIFLSDYVYYEWREGNSLAFTELEFEEDSSSIIKKAYSYGQFYRMFCSSIVQDAVLTVDERVVESLNLTQGTFLYDFIDLLRNSPTVSTLITNSKLSEAYTYAMLLECMSKNICSYGYRFTLPEENERSYYILTVLKEYERATTAMRDFFSAEGVDFPSEDIMDFWRSLSLDDKEKIYPEEDLMLSDFTKDKIKIMCFLNERYFELYKKVFFSIRKFLLHISIDSLSVSSSKKLKDYIQNR